MTSFDGAVPDTGELRTLYRTPAGPAVAKQIDHLDAGARDFIARSPFLVVASGSDTGCDVSPRGGPPGFTVVLDDYRLAFGDLAGNNRLDTFTNLLANPAVGLLFLVPGLDETLRVNGRGAVTTDPAVLDATGTALGGRRPKVAVGVEVEECYIHCGKAFRRSGLWQPETWLDRTERPDAACIVRDHLQVEVEPAAIQAALEADYEATMWEPGGR